MSVALEVVRRSVEGKQKGDQVHSQAIGPGTPVKVFYRLLGMRQVLQNTAGDKGVHTVILKGQGIEVTYDIHGLVVKKVYAYDMLVEAVVAAARIDDDLFGGIQAAENVFREIKGICRRYYVPADRVIVIAQQFLEPPLHFVQVICARGNLLEVNFVSAYRKHRAAFPAISGRLIKCKPATATGADENRFNPFQPWIQFVYSDPIS